MKTLLTADELRDGVTRLTQEVIAHYRDQPLTVLGIMTGSIMLLADMIRQLPMPLEVGVVQASSYRVGTQRGELVLNDAFLPDIAGKAVLLVDDIFDTGHTLARMHAMLAAQQPASLRTAVLLRKSGRQEVVFRPDHVAFEIPDEFVVGYGLDYEGQYRQLPYLAVLEPTDIQRPHS